MIPAQQVIDLALKAAGSGRHAGTETETIVLVTDRAEASLRWAGNSMTTNGVSNSRTTTVVTIARDDEGPRAGSLCSAEVDPALIPELVAASAEAAAGAPE
ncbi:MAG: TldD/PmbA family protein, partial [Mycolicibacter sinensis]